VLAAAAPLYLVRGRVTERTEVVTPVHGGVSA
jgi:hypothetical protein